MALRERFHERVALLEREGARAFTEARVDRLVSPEHRDRLKAVRAPTIVLCGDQDSITGPAESRVLAEGISGAELRVVPGGGRLLNQEKPDVVNAALRRHWDKFDGHDGGKP